METLPVDATKEHILAFGREWTHRLAQEDYQAAFDMLLFVPNHPGKSWVQSAEELHAWVENAGTDERIPGEPLHKVTPPQLAEGEAHHAAEKHDTPRYPRCRWSLDLWLPLDGEWSDLLASFDFVEQEGTLSPFLVALRVP